jgi:hypothetical protein
MYVNKHCAFHCSKSKTMHGGTPVQTIMYISITKGLCTLITHIDYFYCRQRAPVGIVLSSSGTSQLGMFDIQVTTKSKYYDHIVLLYLESRRCRYRSIIRLLFIALFDDFNLMISIFHCLCPSFYLYLSNR